MTQLRDREVVISIGDLRLASRSVAGERKPILRTQFRVELTDQKEPNQAEISIFNLASQSRTRVQKKGVLSKIEAGYIGNTSLIFRGNLDYGTTTKQGTDWVTSLQSSDGGPQFRGSRINTSFTQGTSIVDAIKAAAEATGLGLGNLATELTKGLPRTTAVQFVKGLVVSGVASQELDKLLKRAGFNMSIQQGQIQLTRGSEPIDPSVAVVLQSGTGLIGSPEAGDDGKLVARSLLQPQLLPGHLIRLKSGLRAGVFEIDGFFRIDKVTFTGDTWGGDWYADCEIRPTK